MVIVDRLVHQVILWQPFGDKNFQELIIDKTQGCSTPHLVMKKLHTAILVRNNLKPTKNGIWMTFKDIMVQNINFQEPRMTGIQNH